VNLAPIALLAVAGTILPAQDLPQWVLNLARVKRQARANFVQLPDYACHETVERYAREARSDTFRLLDTLHFEVAVIGGKEIYAKAAGGQFEETDPGRLAKEGAINTGSFAATVDNLFVNDNSRTTGWGEDAVGSRRAIRYDFSISEMMSGNLVSNGVTQVTTEVRGSYWADASTFDLVRVEEHAVDIPPALGMADVSTILDFRPVEIGKTEVLLPSRAELTITETSGRLSRNVTGFSGCRKYASESVIHYDGPETATPPAAPPKKK
jgi:hypothetical protein